MLERAGVSVERGAFNAQLATGRPPPRDSGENFAQNGFRGRRLEPKTSRNFECAGQTGFILLFADGCVVHADPVYLGDRI